MRTPALALALSLAVGGAHAAEKAPCASLEKVQKAAGKDTTITPMSRAQFHFLQGLYVASPSTPDGLPPGDGALILAEDKTDVGLILWMRGSLACAPMPISKVKALMKVLADVKRGAATDGDAL